MAHAEVLASGGIVRAPRRPHGWTAPGPRPSAPDADDMEWAKQAFAEVERKESS